MSDGDHHPQICLITLSWIEAKKDRGNQDYSLGSEEHFLVYRGFQHSYPQDMSLVGHPGEQAGQNHSQLAHKVSVAQREAGPHSQHPLEPGSLGVPSSPLQVLSDPALPSAMTLPPYAVSFVSASPGLPVCLSEHQCFLH